MLEQENTWAECEEGIFYMSYKEGYQIGKIEGEISCVKYVLREEKKYKKLLEHNENIPEDIQRRHDVNLRCMEEERMQDIICFLGKYPSLSKSQLAKRVLWESEYWY